MAVEPRRVPSRDDEWTRTIHLEERRLMCDFFVSEWDAFHMQAETVFEHEHKRQRQRLIASMYAEMDRRIVVKREAVSVHYPSTWWDAFKERWFPAWAKRRWPPRFDGMSIPAVNIDEPVYKACYVNLPRQPSGGGMMLFEVMKPDKAKEYEREMSRFR